MNSKQLRIYSWNADGLTSNDKINELHLFIKERRIDVLLIQETHLKSHNSDKLNLNGYILYHTARTTGAMGGTAILVNSKIDHMHLQTPATIHLEITAIKINTKLTGELLICSAYNSPSPTKRMKPQDLSAIFHWAGTTPTLVAGDLNAKHPDWNARVSNPNGAILRNHQDTNSSYQILATEEPTHFPKNRSLLPDVLDIVLVKNLKNDVNLTVICALESDHNPVRIALGADSRDPTLPYQRKHLNGNKFKNFMTNNTPTLPTTSKESTEDAILALTSAIQVARAISTEMTQVEPDSDADLLIKHLVNEKNQLRRRYQRTRDPELKRQLNQSIRNIREITKETLNDKMTTRLQNIRPGHQDLWRETKALLATPNSNPPILKPDGQTTYKSEEKVEVIADHLEDIFKPSTSSDGTESDIEYECSLALLEEPENIGQLSFQQLTEFVKDLKKGKAPGHDRISNELVQLLPEISLRYLTQIYNACLHLHYFPKIWKIAKIVTFVKPGKTGTRCDEHRPISLLPVLGKLFEKILLKEIVREVDDNLVLQDEQFGFKPGHSTSQALCAITEAITAGFNVQQKTGLVTLDAEKAFDKTWHPAIIAKLSRIPSLKKFVHTINSYLQNRTFYVQIKNASSSPRPIRASVPQGSLLAPILYNLVMYDIPRFIFVRMIIYADDVTFFCTHWDPIVIILHLTHALDAFARWQKKWKMTSNAAKSKAILFSRQRAQPNLPPIPFNQSHIAWYPEVKLLGLTFDPKLNWKAHINETISRSTKRRGMLHNLLYPHSPTSLRTKLVIYLTLIRPIIMYAVPTWTTTASTTLNKLQTFQNKFLRLITGAPWFVRNSIISNDLKIEPILEHARKLSEKFFEVSAYSENELIRNLGAIGDIGPYPMPSSILTRAV